MRPFCAETVSSAYSRCSGASFLGPALATVEVEANRKLPLLAMNGHSLEYEIQRVCPENQCLLYRKVGTARRRPFIRALGGGGKRNVGT